ncbi:lipopolysaccharide biosynthesis protein [Propionibacteriaceae bacterium Y2011]
MAGNRSAAAHVALGTATTSLSKWFLVWLFARSAGGADAVGVYSYVLAIATPLFVLSQLGLRTIFLSSATRWPWRTYLLLRLIGCLVGAAVLMAVIVFSPDLPVGLGVAITLLKVFDSVLDIMLARMQYGNRLVALGRVVTACGVGAMVAAAVAVVLTGSATIGVFAAALSSVGAAVWAFLAGRSVDYEPTDSSRGWRDIVRTAAPVTASQFLATFLFQLPVFALSWVADAGTIGVFAGAAYLLTVAGLTGSTLQTVLITPFRRIREHDGVHALRRRAGRITVRAVLVSAGFGVLVTALGSPVLTLVYGPGFEMGYVPLALLAVAAVATIGAFVMSVTLNVLNRYGGVTLAMGLSCVAAALAGGLFHLLGLPPLIVATGMSATGSSFRLLMMTWSVRRAVAMPAGPASASGA